MWFPRPKRRYRFVLLHGSWHTGDAWDRVARWLRGFGHIAHTPTIAGHGPGVDKRVSHAQAVASILDYLDEHHLDDMVLVGHSFAGTILTKLAEQIPERIRRLVFLNAFVLRDGASLMDEIPPNYRELFRRLEVDGTVMLPFDVWREAFINDADHDLATSAYDALSPEPMRMFTDRLNLHRFYELIAAGRLRCSYLNATEDVSLPHGEWAWHPRFSARLGLCRIVQMPGSHEAVFTVPDLLARKLVEAGRD